MTTSLDTRASGWADGILAVARAEGRLAALSDELFQVARAVESNEALRRTLVDEMIPMERREAIVEDLLGGRGALRLSQAVVTFILAAGRGSQLPEIIDDLVARAAADANKAVAEVRSAIPLDASQIERLAVALAQATGRDVEVRVIVDPTILGGIVARVGDRVIDGSVRGKLRKLRESA
jgi:F-type H+-transporting ATPase subunit delta